MQKIKTLFLIVFSGLMLSACAQEMAPLNFNAPNVGVSQKKIPAELRAITVDVARPGEQVGRVAVSAAETGGYPQGGTGGDLTLEWEGALEEALNRMAIFQDGSEKTVALLVSILKLDPPSMGTVFETPTVARYELLDRNTGDIIFMTDISSNGATNMEHAFAANVRQRESINRSVQNNIILFLQQLETVDVSRPMFPAGTEPPEPKDLEPMDEDVGAEALTS